MTEGERGYCSVLFGGVACMNLVPCVEHQGMTFAYQIHDYKGEIVKPKPSQWVGQRQVSSYDRYIKCPYCGATLVVMMYRELYPAPYAICGSTPECSGKLFLVWALKDEKKWKQQAAFQKKARQK